MVVKKQLANIVQDIENKFLGLFKTLVLQVSIIEEVKEGIITNIICGKQEQLDKRPANRVISIITSYKKKLNQKKKSKIKLKQQLDKNGISLGRIV